MALVHVPKPKNAYDPDRPVGSLLKSQVEHLREAESKLPLRYRQEIETYIKAVKTEGEAARYIRAVTEAIHQAHDDAERERRAPKHERGIALAAAADEGAGRKQTSARKRSTAKSNKRASTKRRKK